MYRLIFAILLFPCAALAQCPTVLSACPSPTMSSTNTSTALFSNANGFSFNASAPTIPSCPVGACYTVPQAVFAGQWLWGKATSTTGGTWLGVDGLYVGVGNGSSTFGAVARYIGAMQGPGAGGTWSFNTNVIRGACPGGTSSLYGQPGSGTPFGTGSCATSPGSLGSATTIGYELDVSNWDADTASSGAFVVGMFINTSPLFTSGAGIFFGGTSGSVAAWHDAMALAPGAAKDDVIRDLSNATIGFNMGGTHANQTFYDSATTPVSIQLGGHYSGAGIYINPASAVSGITTGGGITTNGILLADNAPNGINISGARASNALLISGTGQYGIDITGTFSIDQIVGNGFYFDPNGYLFSTIPVAGTSTYSACWTAGGQLIKKSGAC